MRGAWLSIKGAGYTVPKMNGIYTPWPCVNTCPPMFTIFIHTVCKHSLCQLGPHMLAFGNKSSTAPQLQLALLIFHANLFILTFCLIEEWKQRRSISLWPNIGGVVCAVICIKMDADCRVQSIADYVLTSKANASTLKDVIVFVLI